MAGAVLDGRRVVRGDARPARRDERRDWGSCSSASSTTSRSCCRRSACRPVAAPIGTIALGWPDVDAEASRPGVPRRVRAPRSRRSSIGGAGSLSDVERAATDRTFLQQTGVRRQHQAPRPRLDLRVQRPAGQHLAVGARPGRLARRQPARSTSAAVPAAICAVARAPSVRAGRRRRPVTRHGGGSQPATPRRSMPTRPACRSRTAPSTGCWRRTCCTTAPTSRPRSPSCAACSRPGGALVAVTNAHDHLRELWDVYTAVTGMRPSFFVDRFDLASRRTAVARRVRRCPRRARRRHAARA